MEIPTTEEVGRALRDGPAEADAEEEVVEGRRRRREAHATPGASSAGNGCCERSTMGLMSGVEGKRGGFVEVEVEKVEVGVKF